MPENEYGGLVSDTPLQWIAESRHRLDTLAFQVDLWSARGALPRNMAEVSTHQKDIQYSSRTRVGTDSFKRIQRLRRAAARGCRSLQAGRSESRRPPRLIAAF
jgi:NTE family protein